MKIKNEFINKNLIALCSAVSVLGLSLPFVKFTVGSGYYTESINVSGFQSIIGDNGNVLCGILLVGPIILIVMNYIKQLEKYRKTIAITIPTTCIIFEIINYVLLSSTLKEAGNALNSYMIDYDLSIGSKTTPHLGFFLLLLSYAATLIAGAMTYYGVTLDKEGFEKVKNGSVERILK